MLSVLAPIDLVSCPQPRQHFGVQVWTWNSALSAEIKIYTNLLTTSTLQQEEKSIQWISVFSFQSPYTTTAAVN